MLPSVFVSHGSPQLVLEGGKWAEALGRLGKRVRELKPSLALVVSAHWLTEGTHLECSANHRTLHDFWGFSKELYKFEYPAKGNPKLCKKIAQSLCGKCVKGRGLDHGAWAVLKHLFPRAEVPVSQLSIDMNLSLKGYLEIGRILRNFRDRILIIASGGAVHNLKDALSNPNKPPKWAVDFNRNLKEAVVKGNLEALLNYRDDLGRLAHPTEEHIAPLFYFLGSLFEGERAEVLYDGFEFGSVSLLSFVSQICSSLHPSLCA